jgi:hypothetical protein
MKTPSEKALDRACADLLSAARALGQVERKGVATTGGVWKAFETLARLAIRDAVRRARPPGPVDLAILAEDLASEALAFARAETPAPVQRPPRARAPKPRRKPRP